MLPRRQAAGARAARAVDTRVRGGELAAGEGDRPAGGEQPAGEGDRPAVERRDLDPSQDAAVYSCDCGMVFAGPVSTSVSCPHCGARQAW
jgi:hypothetical protein